MLPGVAMGSSQTQPVRSLGVSVPWESEGCGSHMGASQGPLPPSHTSERKAHTQGLYSQVLFVFDSNQIHPKPARDGSGSLGIRAHLMSVRGVIC